MLWNGGIVVEVSKVSLRKDQIARCENGDGTKSWLNSKRQDYHSKRNQIKANTQYILVRAKPTGHFEVEYDDKRFIYSTQAQARPKPLSPPQKGLLKIPTTQAQPPANDNEPEIGWSPWPTQQLPNGSSRDHGIQYEAAHSSPSALRRVDAIAPRREHEKKNIQFASWSWFTKVEVKERMEREKIHHGQPARKRFLKMKNFFGRKKAEPKENPYAQQQAQEEYDRMTPYQRARADLNNNPRPNMAGGPPSGPGPRRDMNASPAQSTQSYGGSTYVEDQPQGYGGSRYGNSQGYGANRFDSNSTAYSANRGVAPSRGSGGYGGLGGRPQDEQQPDTSELYGGGAYRNEGPNRYGSQPQQPDQNPNRYAPGANQGNRVEEEDNEYADEELTQEQLEERELRKIKAQRLQERNDANTSRQRTLAMARQAEETGLRTLANLGSQAERLNRVEQNLNMSASHARNSEAKTKELKTYSRSMFAVHVENPLTKNKRLAEREQAFLDQDRSDRGAREAVRGEGYRMNREDEEFFEDIERKKQQKYGNVHDEDMSEVSDVSDDEEEDERQGIKDEKEILAIASRLHNISVQHGHKIQQSSRAIDRIAEKTDGVTDHVVKNSAKLRTFK
ncbi:Protein transport protein sec9 [Zalerion maritima]|uniref:Protein transport protein sec9 n=1 Tax=Zalerion maritima TaxID=339359 RepID=A0AAD5RNX5_9PEZI|nr:Protein transport protein sec9 [Zalerion maritima]